MDKLQKIKRLTISALLADDILMALLVLKGGNAIDIGYDLSNRGSIDIDFSMENDFSPKELDYLRNQVESLLNEEFAKEGLVVFDVSLKEKPQVVNDAVKSFWGGYLLEFKVIEKDAFDSLNGDLEKMRRGAIPLEGGGSSTKFQVDISKFEYIRGKRSKDMDGIILQVYSPEMIVIEKTRALCQQNPNYRKVVFSMTPKSRGRDLYDFHNLVESFKIDLTNPENIELFNSIFDAKKVPLSYLNELNQQRELHRQSWDSVLQTINQNEEVKDFDYYFDYLLERVSHISPAG